MSTRVALLVLAACGPELREPDEDEDAAETTGSAPDEPELWGFAASWPPGDLRPVVTVALDDTAGASDGWCARTREEQLAAGAVVSDCRRIEALWCEGAACYFDAATCERWAGPGAGCERRP